MLPKPITLAIVDDHALFRKILKDFLSNQHNIRVALQAESLFDLQEQLKGIIPDILLMDMFMPGLNGAAAVKFIRKDYPTIRILVVSMSTDMDLVGELLDLGIHGYISKSDDPEDLVDAVHAASENRIYRNRVFTEALYWNKQDTMHAYPQNGVLTKLNERERKIVQLLWEEKSNREIADELFLGVRSVEKIRQGIKDKLGVKSTVGMFKYAIRKHIIGLNMVEQKLNSNR